MNLCNEQLDALDLLAHPPYAHARVSLSLRKLTALIVLVFRVHILHELFGDRSGTGYRRLRWH